MLLAQVNPEVVRELPIDVANSKSACAISVKESSWPGPTRLPRGNLAEVAAQRSNRIKSQVLSVLRSPCDKGVHLTP
jgi:hypothetical protein